MVLSRHMDAAPPERWKGIQFRSKLELHVARHLDDLGLGWQYERPVEHNGRRIRYLPDFTMVTDAPEAEEWAAPDFIEVKPQEFIYSLRDHLGVDEHLNGDMEREHGADAARLRELDIEELWKPKALAELLGCTVLVCGGVNRSRTLSVLMQPHRMVFQRNHPIVNTKGVLAEAEREAKRQRWAAEAERWREEMDRRERERELERQRVQAARLESAGRLIRHAERRQARFDGTCRWCNDYVTAIELSIFLSGDRWVPICKPCVADIHAKS